MKYEYKNVEFLFLTREYEELEQFVDDCNSDMLGLVPMELYDEFVHQVTSFASRNGIKNMAAAVSKIIEIARKDAEVLILSKFYANAFHFSSLSHISPNTAQSGASV